MAEVTAISNNKGAKSTPLSTLLSQLLVAFTIEFDNEAENQLQHWTTAARSAERRQGVWLTSMVMWSNVMRFVPEQGVSIGNLQRQARTEKLQLNGLQRWGYIVVAPDPADPRPKPPQRDWLVRPSIKGRMVQEIWRPLGGVIERRWRERFGGDAIERLREALVNLLRRIDLAMPEYLPILGYGLFSEVLRERDTSPAIPVEDCFTGLPLSALLAKTLLAFTLEFESEWKISLPTFSNALRLLDEKGIRIASLPALSGVSKEAVQFMTGWLEKAGCAEIAPNPTAKGKLIRLTPKGLVAKQACSERLAFIEGRWRERFSNPQIASLHESLQALIDHKDGEQSSLSQGLAPYPEGWRARKPYLAQTQRVIADPAGNLPHFPMVLHRGGYPDGS